MEESRVQPEINSNLSRSEVRKLIVEAFAMIGLGENTAAWGGSAIRLPDSNYARFSAISRSLKSMTDIQRAFLPQYNFKLTLAQQLAPSVLDQQILAQIKFEQAVSTAPILSLLVDETSTNKNIKLGRLDQGNTFFKLLNKHYDPKKQYI